ncbi:ribosomal maturation YjgA family protein [Flavobacterium sp. 25HG05S-40]|uniref:ribosomal maturation YjgA family protein n=1 Tax=Flavobacterium sp. 25HG05S-40 TaxID=3458682 RepID=UPI00404469E2
MLKFHKTYFGLTMLLFVIEVLIALFVNDRIIRPYIGDVLVVMLIYCFVKTFLNTKVFPTAIGVLLFAIGIETLQYFNIVEKLGLQDNRLARTVIGASFEWMDILCYVVGILMVLVVEKSAKGSRL